MDDKLTDPKFFPSLCDHIISGGTLPEVCKTFDLKYSKVREWIYSHPDRARDYEAALAARGEWFIQTILQELKDIATADIRDAYDDDNNLLPVNKWPASLARVVAAVETSTLADFTETKRLKLWDKLRALELLGKNLRMFKEQVEHTGHVSLEDLVTGSMIEHDTHLSIPDERAALPGS